MAPVCLWDITSPYYNFKRRQDIKLTYIPEKGGVPAMQSVVAAKVKAGFNNLSDAFRNQDRGSKFWLLQTCSAMNFYRM